MFKLYNTVFKFLSALLLLTAPLIGFCQISVPKWVDDIGGPGGSSSIPCAVKADQQNNIYVAGIYSGTVDFDPSAGVYNLTSIAGSFDSYLAKYTSAGKLIWAVSVGGDGLDQANSLTLDNNGFATISGQFNSSKMDADPGPGVVNLVNNGGYDAFAVRFDSNGNLSWAKSIGGLGTEYGVKVTADNSGNVVWAVQFQQSVVVGSKTYSAQGSTFNALYVKYDASGNVVWTIDLGDTGECDPSYSAFDKNGNIVVCGLFSNNVDFNPLGTSKFLNGNGGSTFLAKYSPAGILIWNTSFAGGIINHNNNLCINSNDDIYLDGPFSGGLDFGGGHTLTAVGSQDLFIAKYSSAGVFQTAKDIGGTGASIYNYGIAVSQDNSVYASGYFSGTIDFDPSTTAVAKVSDHGQRDLFLAKYDIDMNYKWAFGAGNNSCNNTLGRNVTVDNNNDVLLVGSFCSTVNFDASSCTTYNLTAQSDIRDSFVAKYVQSQATPTSQITAFSIPQQSAPAIIDQTNLKITVTVPAGTNVTALQPAITASSGVTLTPASGLAQNFSGPITYKLTNGCSLLNYTVTVITLTVNSITVCSGATSNITGDAATPTPTSYLWQLLQNGTWGTASGNASQANYTTPALINNSSADLVYSYRRQTIISGIIGYDSYNNITVTSLVTNNTLTAPATTTFCASGDPAVITGSTPSGGSGTYTYQWQSSADNITFTNITGATARDYDPPILTATTYFRRVITSAACAIPPLSNVITITIQPSLSNNFITAPPVVSFCGSGDADPITGNTPSGGNGTLAYQWQSSTDNITFIDITGAVSKDFDPPLINSTTYYRRMVSSGACTPPLASNVITIQAFPPVTNNTLTPPATTSFCASGNPAVITGSTPSGGSSAYTYQWQSSADNITFTDITGATAKDYDPPVLIATTYYRRLITSAACATPPLSNVITITVQPALSNNVISAPATISFCGNGDAAVITGNIPAGGNSTYSYQWQSSADNITFADIVGANSQSYDPPLLNATTYYRRTVTSGTCSTPLLSNAITVKITSTPATPVPVSNTLNICYNTQAPLAVSAPVNGITYNWYTSTLKTSLLFTGSSYTTPALTASATYYIEAVNGTCTSAAMGSVQVNVAPFINNPVLVSNAISTCSGTTATLTISAPQSGITYNWYTTPSGGSPVFTGTTNVISGITSSITYYVDAANAAGCTSATRTVATITVNPTPAAPQLSASTVGICPGTTATITAVNTDPTVTISWYSAATGGTAIATGNTYTTPVLNANNTYYAEAATNVYGCTSTSRSIASVQMLQQLPAPVVTVGDVTSTSITFQWSAITGATGYLVSLDNGLTFVTPSSGSAGLLHKITGLQPGQSVSIIARATGASCQLSSNSVTVTTIARNPLGSPIYVPNVFTPNNDGNNDILYVYGIDIKSLNLYVYSQWGELLFQSNNQANGWDGTYKGAREPVGVYVYYLTVVTNNGEKVSKKGTITLVR